MGVEATASVYVYGPPPGPPPMRLSTPGSATSAPGHFFGPSPMRLSIPGPAPGPPAGTTMGLSTSAWGHGPMGPPLINLSTPGPAPGTSTGSTTGLTTSAPGHVSEPQHASVPTPGISAKPTTESSTGPGPGASSGSGLGSENINDFLGADTGTNDTAPNVNHVEMEANSATV